MTTLIDQLVMLLSSDWFLPRWHLIGLGAGKEEKIALQHRCRILTSNFLDGEVDYWMISFAEERISHTRSEFFDSVVECNLTKFDVENLHQITDSIYDEKSKNRENSILISLTELLSKNPSGAAEGTLSPSVVGVVQSISSGLKSEAENMSDECLASNSVWDRQLRALTPDLPEYLGDFASDLANTSDNFFIFWKKLIGKLDTEQKTSLIAWYRAAALELVGNNIKFSFSEN